MQVLKRLQRVERLTHFHSDCELNYARLLKLVGTNTDGAFVFQSGEKNEVELHIDVSKESKYTRLFSLQCTMHSLPWANSQKMFVRVYDDARMAEIVSANNNRVRFIHYTYPNKDMYAPDEKNQLNHLLGHWLVHMLAKGVPKTK